MSSQELTLASKVLITLLETHSLVFGLRGRIIDKVYHPSLDPDRHLIRTIYYLQQKGLIRSVDKEGKRFIKLTKRGRLRTLLEKFDVNTNAQWDGKWRVLMFDIPESVNALRSQLVYHLKDLSFVKLQGSVYISPFAFNESAMEYLKISGLTRFIRLLLVEKIDDDKDLRKIFEL